MSITFLYAKVVLINYLHTIFKKISSPEMKKKKPRQKLFLTGLSKKSDILEYRISAAECCQHEADDGRLQTRYSDIHP